MLDLQTVANFMSVTKDLNSFWKSLDKPNQVTLDDLVRKAAKKFIPDSNEEFMDVKRFLVDGKDDLAQRLIASSLHPSTKGLIARLSGGEDASDDEIPLSSLPPEIMVTCKNCKHPNHVVLAS